MALPPPKKRTVKKTTPVTRKFGERYMKNLKAKQARLNPKPKSKSTTPRTQAVVTSTVKKRKATKAFRAGQTIKSAPLTSTTKKSTATSRYPSTNKAPTSARQARSNERNKNRQTRQNKRLEKKEGRQANRAERKSKRTAKTMIRIAKRKSK